jgi:hypothetical protein
LTPDLDPRLCCRAGRYHVVLLRIHSARAKQALAQTQQHRSLRPVHVDPGVIVIPTVKTYDSRLSLGPRRDRRASWLPSSHQYSWAQTCISINRGPHAFERSLPKRSTASQLPVPPSSSLERRYARRRWGRHIDFAQELEVFPATWTTTRKPGA